MQLNSFPKLKATNTSCFLVAVDQDTQTNQFLEKTGEFVIAAPEERLFEVALYASTVSGKQEDKWGKCGLECPLFFPDVKGTPNRPRHLHGLKAIRWGCPARAC